VHELGIASSIIETVETESRRHPGARVCAVGLRLGEWAGVDPDSLRFCFEALVKHGALDPLSLEIAQCPGDELVIAYLEVEQP
jgi:hydrogenase nickel incorporation protein HypA/HybF